MSAHRYRDVRRDLAAAGGPYRRWATWTAAGVPVRLVRFDKYTLVLAWERLRQRRFGASFLALVLAWQERFGGTSPDDPRDEPEATGRRRGLLDALLEMAASQIRLMEAENRFHQGLLNDPNCDSPEAVRVLELLTRELRECWLTMEVGILSFTTDTDPRVIADFLAMPLVVTGDRSTRLAQILDRALPHLPSHINPAEFWLEATQGFLTAEDAEEFRAAWEAAAPCPCGTPRHVRTRGTVSLELPSTDRGGGFRWGLFLPVANACLGSSGGCACSLPGGGGFAP